MPVRLTQDPDADEVLSSDPFALLVGMLLDQQVPMEWAFSGPATIKQRFGSLDPAAIAAAEPEAFAALCAQTPAIHRFPGSMAGRVQALAAHIEQEYENDAAALWSRAGSGQELLKRLQALPGYGKQKSQIFLALLGKQLGVCPEGWREAAGTYGEEGVYRSVADIVDGPSLEKVRAYKKEMKAKTRS